jgi:hypothetical protein
MNIILYNLLILLCLISSCGPQDTVTHNNVTHNDKTQHNPWADKALWGSPISSIDFSGKTLFQDDFRIAEIHKEAFPEFHNTYVLWRMTHDGSCWVSASLTLLLFQMIEGGLEKFTDVLEKMKTFAKTHVSSNESHSLDDFFNIFELITHNFSHRFSLDLRNHQRIYDKLDHGMRVLLAAYLRSYGGQWDRKRAEEIQPPKKGGLEDWGLADEFNNFFKSLGISCPVIDIYNTDRIQVFAYNKGWIEPPYFKGIKERPPMLIIHSRKAYIDVLVEKKFSDKVNDERI